MNELDDTFIKRIQEDLSKNPEHKLFVEQNNYISEEAAAYVFFMIDQYIKFGGKPTVDKIRLLFGMNESTAQSIIEHLHGKGTINEIV